VKAGAGAGDGSLAAPFSSIADAVAAAPDGAVIAVAKGHYDNQVLLSRGGLALWGACPSATTVRNDARPGATMTIHGIGISVRNLGVEAGSGSPFALNVDSEDGPVDLWGLVLRGVLVVSGPGVHAESVRLVKTSTNGPVVRVFDAGELSLSRAVIESPAVDAALQVQGEQASAMVTDAYFRGAGMYAAEGAHLTARRVLIDDGPGRGLLVYQSASFSGDLIIIRDRTSAQGDAASVQHEAQADIQRLLIEGTCVTGLAIGASATASVTDFVARDLETPETSSSWGSAVGLNSGVLTGARWWIARPAAQGVFVGPVNGPECKLDSAAFHVEDLVVTSPQAQCCDELSRLVGGSALAFDCGATASIARARIEGALGAGLELRRNVQLAAEDLVVRGTERRSPDQLPAVGIGATSNSRLTVSRGLLERNKGYSISADASSVSLTDIHSRQFDQLGLRMTDSEAALTGVCTARRCLGIGMLIERSPQNAPFSLERFNISRCADSGIMLFAEGGADLETGVISENGLAGVRLLQAMDNVRRLMVQVQYAGNRIALSYE
jgi:hypothetical protein